MFLRIRRRTWRRVGAVLLCVALSVGALTAIARWTGGSYDIVSQIRGDRNPANLLTVEDYTVEKNKNGKMEASTRYGIDYKVKEDGRVVLTGTNKNYEGSNGEKYQTVPFAAVTLKAGEYTLSGYEKAGANTLGVYALVNGNEVRGDIDGTFKLSQESTVVIGFYIYNDVRTFNTTLSPVLVAGATAGSFYTK